DNLYPVLDKYLPALKEGDVIFITSKIVAIHQGRCLEKTAVPHKDELVKQEADFFIPRAQVPGRFAILTIKEHTLIPAAGIDKSNANGYYILWPKNASQAAKEICNYLKNKNKLKNLAVVITDSHSIPMRYGVVGIAIGFFGLEPLKDCRRTLDIFGRKLRITKSNTVDALTATAVMLMGEGAEKTPILIARGAGLVQFTSRHTYQKLVIPPKEDIYYPLLKEFYKRRR
ncbi:MAG: coenzyme F420-0:L-glutamate ligase, partial [Patescibacteria group bacterium]